MFAHIRALLAFAILAGLLVFPAAAMDAHVLSTLPAAVAVDEHHHHHVDDSPGSGGVESPADPRSHYEGDGGHSHMPSPVADLDARTPQVTAPALFAKDVRLAPRPDDSSVGWLTLPQKRPPRFS